MAVAGKARGKEHRQLQAEPDASATQTSGYGLGLDTFWNYDRRKLILDLLTAKKRPPRSCHSSSRSSDASSKGSRALRGRVAPQQAAHRARRQRRVALLKSALLTPHEVWMLLRKPTLVSRAFLAWARMPARLRVHCVFRRKPMLVSRAFLAYASRMPARLVATTTTRLTMATMTRKRRRGQRPASDAEC